MNKSIENYDNTPSTDGTIKLNSDLSPRAIFKKIQIIQNDPVNSEKSKNGQTLKIQNEEGNQVEGVHTFTYYDLTSEEAQAISKQLDNLTKKFARIPRQQDNPLYRSYQTIYQNLKSKLSEFKSKEFQVKNLITTNGLQKIAINTALGGNGVNYTALGANSTAPSLADTTLAVETYRKAIANATASGTKAVIETFLSPTDIVGTFEEYGNFIDGTAGADTGILLNRFTVHADKSSVESLIIFSEFTFANA